jgi:hypothetical protein
MEFTFLPLNLIEDVKFGYLNTFTNHFFFICWHFFLSVFDFPTYDVFVWYYNWPNFFAIWLTIARLTQECESLTKEVLPFSCHQHFLIFSCCTDYVDWLQSITNWIKCDDTFSMPIHLNSLHRHVQLQWRSSPGINSWSNLGSIRQSFYKAIQILLIHLKTLHVCTPNNTSFTSNLTN